MNHTPTPSSFTFIDLFAGIGGFHEALRALGGHCVFASEIDKHAKKVYLENHHADQFADDIQAVAPEDVPLHDILCAGFPCQPFSQAGYRKGFGDTRGTLFFNIMEIIRAARPAAYFLENVRYLKNHDNGRTFRIIEEHLREEGYSFYSFTVKATDHGLPQPRPRLFLLGYRDGHTFIPPKPRDRLLTMSDILGGSCSRDIGFTLRCGGRHSPIKGRHNWDGYIVDGVERRLTVREAAKMQGFPEHFRFPVRDAQAMKQLGNSVAVPAIYDYAKQLITHVTTT